MANYYEITDGPDEFPVTLAEVKLYLKIDYTDDDDILNSLIEMATDICEKYTGRWFVERDATAHVDNVRQSKFEACPFIEIARAPILNVSSVLGLSGGVYAEVDGWELKQTGGFGRVVFFEGVPVLDCDKPYPIQALFTGGYGPATAVPEALKTAIKTLVDMVYNNRGDCCPDGLVDAGLLPATVKMMLNAYKILVTFSA